MQLYERAAARYPAEKQKRCVSCGFLALHRVRWYEADDADRATGSFDTAGYGGTPESTNITCFRHEADLAVERLQHGGGSAGALLAINVDRNCQAWYPYTPGFSPQEHLEELRMIQLEQERQRHDREMAQLQQDSDKRSQAIAEELRKTADATKSFTTIWTYVAVGVAVLALAVLAASYLFPALGPQFGHSVAPGLQPTP